MSQVTFSAAAFFGLLLTVLAFGAGVFVGEHYQPLGLDKKQNNLLLEHTNRFESNEAEIRRLKEKVFPH